LSIGNTVLELDEKHCVAWNPAKIMQKSDISTELQKINNIYIHTTHT